MPDAVIYKPQHSNGPPAALYDVSNGSGTYIEEVLGAGWDPVNLKPVKLKVDANGQLYIANPGGGGSGGGSGQIVVQGSDAAGTNVGYGSGVLNVPIQGTVTSVPSGTQNVSVQNTPAVTQSGVWSTTVTQGTASNLQATITGTVAVSGTLPVTVGGTVPVSVPGNVTVISGTATNLLAQVSGTVTTTPSGTQNVTVIGTVPVSVSTTVTVQGTVTNVPSGTQTTLPTGTLAVSQSGSPWGISGTTTSIPTGTQTVTIIGTDTVVGTVTAVPSGTQTAALGGLTLVTDFAITTTLPVRDYEVCERLDTLIASATFTDTGPGANFALGRVGPQLVADGGWGTNRYDRSGALTVADGHARYQEPLLRGGVFGAATQAGISLSAQSATVTGFALYNPINSGKILIILEWHWGLTGNVLVTGSTANLFLTGIGPNIPTPTGVTTLTPFNCLIGSPNNPVGIAYSTATFNTVPNRLKSIGNLQFAGTAGTAACAMSIATTINEAAGNLAIAPGGYVAFGVSVAQAINAGMLWEEVPL